MKKSKPTPDIIQPIQTYGLPLIQGYSQFQYNQAAFAKRLPMSVGLPSRWEQFKRIADFIVPGHFEWHDWTERAIKPLLPDVEVPKLSVLRGFAGCAGSAKTFNITSFACVWWLMWPEQSSVTLVSTTKNMLRRRAWAEVQKIYFSIRDGQRFGNMVDSRTLWQADRGDDKHAIIAQAVEEGSIQKVVDNIKGTHTRRQMIIVDEATSIPGAIYEACSNLYSYPDEFILAVIGNPWNRLDQFGLFCEPDKGWNSVSVESGEWEAKPFEHCGGEKPYVMTFDAEKSPNIIEGKVVSRHLPKKEEVEQAKKNSNGGNTPHYWQNKRGFWPPEGLIETVFTNSMFNKYDVIRGKHDFKNGNFFLIAALDPAFGGGDAACLRFAKMGTVEGGHYGLQIMPPVFLQINANDKNNPVTHQICKSLMRHCDEVDCGDGIKKSCLPNRIGIDDSGEGGLGDVIYKDWSHQVIRIVFQGAASDEQVSIEDPRPAKEVYWNKRAEMYFYARSAVESGQVRGIDEATAAELCSIEFDKSKKRTLIQDKHEYRDKHAGKSPDKSDSFVMLFEVARRLGFKLAAVGQTAKVVEEIDDSMKKADEVYHDENLYQQEEMEEIESFQ